MKLANVLTTLDFRIEKRHNMELGILYSGSGLGGVSFEWNTKSGTEEKVKEADILAFVDDTKNLIKRLGYDFYGKHIGIDNVIKLIKGYWGEWGPLFPCEDNRVTLTDIVSVCWIAHSLDLLWHASKEDEIDSIDIAKGLFEYARFNSKLTKKDRQILELPMRDLLELVTVHEESRYGPFWGPATTQSPFRNGVPYRLILPIPDPGAMSEPQTQREYLRKSVMNYIAAYISELKLSFRFEVDDQDIRFVGSTDNHLCAYLMRQFIGKREIVPCACGCGRPAPKGASFATPQCRDRLRNQDPVRMLKSRVRTRCIRLKVPNTIREELYRLIDSLDKDGYTNEEIESVVTTKLKGYASKKR